MFGVNVEGYQFVFGLWQFVEINLVIGVNFGWIRILILWVCQMNNVWVGIVDRW